MALPLRNITNHSNMPNSLLQSVKSLARLVNTEYRDAEHDVNAEIAISDNGEDISVALTPYLEHLVNVAYRLGVTAADSH